MSANAWFCRVGIGDMIFSAAQEQGFDIIDTNGASQAGFGVPQVYMNE